MMQFLLHSLSLLSAVRLLNCKILVSYIFTFWISHSRITYCVDVSMLKKKMKISITKKNTVQLNYEMSFREICTSAIYARKYWLQSCKAVSQQKKFPHKSLHCKQVHNFNFLMLIMFISNISKHACFLNDYHHNFLALLEIWLSNAKQF